MSTNELMDVYNIMENEDGKAKWLKIGTAFVNRDGSINVLLDAYPRDGKLQIRKKRAAETSRSLKVVGTEEK